MRKSVGDKVVLDGINRRCQREPISALLGPSGAGKATTVNVLTTLLAPLPRRLVRPVFTARAEPWRVDGGRERNNGIAEKTVRCGTGCAAG